jgi:hypothetical protein
VAPPQDGGQAERSLRKGTRLSPAHAKVTTQSTRAVQLPQPGHRLEPPEDLIDLLAGALAHIVAGVPCGAPVEGTAPGFLGHMGREADRASALDEIRRIEALFGAHGRAPDHTRDPLQQAERILHLDPAARAADHRITDQTMLVVDHSASQIGQQRPRLRRLPREAGLGIRHRAVRLVGAPLAMETDAGVGRIHRALGIVVHRAHAVLARPRLQQGPFHREVLPRQQVCFVGHCDGLGQELASDRPIEQALPVLGKGGGVPRRRLQVEADKPAEEQVVLELPDKLPLVAARVEQLQQKGPQQLLRRDRQAPGLAVQRHALGR